MGILNLTPDSFSDGGRYVEPAAALSQAHRLVAAGARMLDLGAESTRPGSVVVEAATEWGRLEPALAALTEALPHIPLSLDTRHATVAARGLAAGASVLNDVDGFADPGMLDLAAGSRCGLIAMRSRRLGAGFLMPPYGDPAPKEATSALAELVAVRDRLLTAGIAAERVLLDPGFGFGTSFMEDLALWKALPRVPEALAWPVDRICIGISRKRFLATRAGTPGLPPDQRDALTAAAHSEAIGWGYRVFRTHALPG
nr:dihydropteroate synthase [Geothrix sp. SG10]